MPELPEIETVKLQLQKVLVGQKLLQSSFKGLIGKEVKNIGRKGKVLLINFGDNLDLGFHFKMTGQLVYIPHQGEVLRRIVGGHPSEDMIAKLPNSHTREIFEFEKGKLFFNDMRKFGWVEINPKFVEKLGPEPFNISAEEFVNRVSKFKRPIKVVIMDQEVISGVGNIYANDALWEAKIDPQTLSYKLQKEQLELLFEKIKLVLREGIKYGGATVDNYLNLQGMGGHYQEHLRVYKREGLPCHRCGSKIQKFILGGRGTFYCPECQSNYITTRAR